MGALSLGIRFVLGYVFLGIFSFYFSYAFYAGGLYLGRLLYPLTVFNQFGITVAPGVLVLRSFVVFALLYKILRKIFVASSS